MLGTGLILYFLSEEMHVITPGTISATSTTGLLIYVIKKYGASPGEFADKLNEQKNAQVEEVKQASIKHTRMQLIRRSHSKCSLTQKCHYLFDVQRNNTAMASEITYWDSCIEYTRSKESPGNISSCKI